MKSYDPKKIEKKWQTYWDKKGIYKAKDNGKKKFYSLIEFPYPSGAGLHVGHIRSNTAMDVISRKRRTEGYNVLYPIGWDAFGLPTENYAIKTGVQPAKVTKQNTDNFRRQLKSLGFSFDWSREINTTDPKYYKWTQWIFLQMFKKGLAYKEKSQINWCPKDKIGLANEEVVNGCCERCGTPVEKREKEQWMLAITKYADRLDKDLDGVDYLEKIKIQQCNWIGRSEGAEISFKLKADSLEKEIKVFTTRADTLFGVTYLVLSPEHPLIMEIFKDGKIENKEEVQKYIESIKNKTDIDRLDATKEKTGIVLKGIEVVNPANGEKLPVWIADYVLASYGTGAVMAVPAHDDRDYEFAKKYKLPIKKVVSPKFELTGDNATRDGFETVVRNTVSAIIKHPKEDKFLIIKEKDNYLFAGGGIEENESKEDALRREIQEETGYININIIKVIEDDFLCSGFRHTKQRNQKTNDTFFFIKLRDEISVESEVDEGRHKIEWVDSKKVESLITWEHHKYIWNIFRNPSAYTGNGIMVKSGKFDGLSNVEAREKITKEFGKIQVKYKLRDWVFSRQRYWGEPIPLIYCAKCAKWHPVPEKDLPLELPKVKKYEPTDNGESPLSSVSKWVNVKCPVCKSPAKRETDTMPQWAGSSWYYLRYMDSKNNKEFASKKKIKYWNPVDWYNGGMEHTTLHLLYSRFWHKFLYDLKLVPTKEPYKKRTSHGLILAGDGDKMSKSKGNVVNPDELVKIWGADSLRVYEMFMGPFDQAIPWSTDNIIGVRRFLERVWKLQFKIEKSKNGKIKNPKLDSLVHQTIKKVGDDIEGMKFNTAISSMMILVNEMESASAEGSGVTKKDFEILLQILSPFAPHITEELWAVLGNKKSINLSKWPKFDAKKILKSEVNIAIQVNGKVRAVLTLESDIGEDKVKEKALNMEEVKKWVEGKEVKKIIYIANKVLNIVVG